MALFSCAFEGDKEVDLYPKLAKKMEENNFYSMQIYEHLPFKPAWPIVFHTAKYTKSMLIGPVTVPVFLHEPLTLARNLALLDELTHGRAILGISRGAYGKYLDRKIDRSIEAVLDSVRAINSLLRGDSHVESRSSVRRPRFAWLAGRKVRIFVGTSGPILASRATTLGAVSGIIVDSLWNPSYARFLRRVIDTASATRAKGRVELIARPFTFISKDISDAEKKIIPILRAYLPDLAGNSPMLRRAGLQYEDLAGLARTSSNVPIEKFAAVGNSNDIVEQTDKMLKAGVDHVCYGHPLSESPMNAISEIGEKVIIHFKT